MSTELLQQRVALADPCRDAMECANQRYRRILREGRYVVSRILTVNVGDE